MENFILIGICLTAGFGLQRLKIFPKNGAIVLNLYVIWIAFPALILVQVPRLSFSVDLLILILMPWIMLLFGAAMVLTAARIFHWSKEITGVLLLTVPLANTSFLGIPMIIAFFGEAMVPYGIIYDQFGSFPALATYGTVVLAIYSGQQQQNAAVAIARKIVTFPPFVALIIALIFGRQLQNSFLFDALRQLSISLVPVVMFSIGLQLTVKLAQQYTFPFIYGLTVKLILAPLVAFFICRAIGLDSAAATVAVFEAGMPPMVVAGALAISAGLAPKLAAAMVGWGIIFSFITLPLLYLLL